MDPMRFDTLARSVGRRASRRGVMAATAGLAALPLLGRSPTTAQESTPERASGPPVDETTFPEFLFVQTFTGGTWQPADEAGLYTLTLEGTAAQTVYFSDRPERIVGLAPMQTFLDSLGFTPANPPNAALVAQRSDTEGREVLVIELFDPVYDAETSTLTYTARVLEDYDAPGLASLAAEQTDHELPESFAHGSLFIDDCPDTTVNCVLDNQLVGSTSVPQIVDRMHPNICVPTPKADNYCNNAFPDECNGHCVARPPY